jgi:hypothetical protein
LTDRQPMYDALIKQGKINEAADLKLLHEAQDKAKFDFSDFCRHMLDMDEKMLKHTGHKSIEAGLLYATKDHVKKLNSLVKAHIKKYPD